MSAHWFAMISVERLELAHTVPVHPSAAPQSVVKLWSQAAPDLKKSM
jgi:hypothetical protein